MQFWSYIVVNIVRPVALWLFYLFFHMEYHGLENIPTDGAVILTPNHVTYLDPILVGLPIKRRLFFMTWDRLFQIPGLNTLMRVFGAYPVKLEGHDRAAVKRTQLHLNAGEAVVIFPEGGRTTSGKLDPFKPGAFRLAARAGVPAVPVTINGAYQIWPPHKTLPRLLGNKVIIYYHPPIYPGADEDLKTRTQEMAHQVRKSMVSTLDPTMFPDDYESLRNQTRVS